MINQRIKILEKIMIALEAEDVPDWLRSVVIKTDKISTNDITPGMISEASALLQLSVARTEIEKEEAEKRRIEAKEEIVSLEDFQRYFKELETELNIYFVEAKEESK